MTIINFLYLTYICCCELLTIRDATEFVLIMIHLLLDLNLPILKRKLLSMSTIIMEKGPCHHVKNGCLKLEMVVYFHIKSLTGQLGINIPMNLINYEFRLKSYFEH